MQFDASLVITLGMALLVVGCSSNPGGDDAADVSDGDTGGGFCCPFDEPSPGQSCEGDCDNCGYTGTTCTPTPYYSCTDGTWEKTDEEKPDPSCFADGGVDTGDVAADGGPTDADGGATDSGTDGGSDADATADTENGDTENGGG